MIRLTLVFLLAMMLADATFAATNFIPNAFYGTFVQEKKSLNTNKIKKSGSTKKTNLSIKYQSPGKIYLKAMGDSDMVYVCNRKKVWIYQPPFIKTEKGNLKVGKSSRNCYSSIFDSLKNGLKKNKAYDVKKINGRTFELTFSEGSRKRLGINKIKLYLKTAKKKFTNLKSFEIFYEEDPHPTILTIKKIKTLKRFKNGTFNFKAPKNTTISNI